jgi:hypothetical protein
MSFRLTDADLSFDSDSDNTFSSYMDAEMDPAQQNQQAQPTPNLLDSLVALRAAGGMSDQEFLKITSALTAANSQNTTTVTNANDIEDHRIQLRLASLTEFRGDKSDFHMAHRWILAVERDLRAIGLQQHQWSLACFRKMPLDSPASLWAESIYGNGGTFAAPDWETWKTSFLGQFMNPNELQAAQTAFNNVHMSPRGSDILEFNEAFRAAAVRLDFAYKANELALDPDLLSLQYLTKLTGAVAIHVNSVVNINAAANRERAREGRPPIKLTMQHLMSEAVQHQKDLSIQGLGGMSTAAGKGPTPMDLDVIQTTPTVEPDTSPSLQAQINAIQTELRSGFRGKKKKRDANLKDDMETKGPFKCYNCGGANHMARHCMEPKKNSKESGKGQDQ